MLTDAAGAGAGFRTLGDSGIRVSRLGVGGGSLATSGDLQETTAMLTACWDAGLRYYDTAPLYGDSEARLGSMFQRHARKDFVVSTKVGRLSNVDGRRRFDFSRAAMERSIANSLSKLAVDYVDLVFIHDLTPAMLGDEYAQASAALLDEGMDYLLELKKQGVVRGVGVSLYDIEIATQLVTSAPLDCCMIVGGYTLLQQDAMGALLPLAVARKVGILVASPFHTGLLVTGAAANARFNYGQTPAELLEKVARIEAVCDRHSIDLAAAALQFPLLHPAVAGVVVGHRTPAEVRSNVASLDTSAPTAFWADMIAQGLLPSNIPFAGPHD